MKCEDINGVLVNINDKNDTRRVHRCTLRFEMCVGELRRRAAKQLSDFKGQLPEFI